MNGLLVLTLPFRQLCRQLPSVVRNACEHVNNILYIHIDPAATVPMESFQSTVKDTDLSITQASYLIKTIYGKSLAPSSLDIRLILTGLKSVSTIPISTKHTVHKVLVHSCNLEQLPHFKKKYRSFLHNSEPVVLESDYVVENGEAELEFGSSSNKIYKDIVAGGTFDHIHSGHKILLSEGLMRCTRKFTIGVADGPLLVKKTLTDLIEPVDVRISKLSNLLSDLDPSVEHYLEPISEPLGPSGRDPDMEMIIVSQETLKGGNYVNKARAERNLSVLDVEVIDIVEDSTRDSTVEEEKVSSSSARMRQLGSLIKTPHLTGKSTSRYIIGLTGGSASGKSSIGKKLQSLGAHTIDCDKLGHRAYEPNTECYNKLVETFGSNILTPEKTINRKALGAQVFGDAEKLTQLNKLVWPEIAKFAQQEMEHVKPECKIVVLDAAVLLEAGWDEMCHEVWVCLLNEEEAVRRITARDNCTPDAARQRLARQMTNRERLARANVLLCSQWHYNYTHLQVKRAWDRLVSSLNKSS